MWLSKKTPEERRRPAFQNVRKSAFAFWRRKAPVPSGRRRAGKEGREILLASSERIKKGIADFSLGQKAGRLDLFGPACQEDVLEPDGQEPRKSGRKKGLLSLPAEQKEEVMSRYSHYAKEKEEKKNSLAIQWEKERSRSVSLGKKRW